MTWQMMALIREYRTYAIVKDRETVVPPSSLEFPQVTVCNWHTQSKWRRTEYLERLSANSSNDNDVNNMTRDTWEATSEWELVQVSPRLTDFFFFTTFNDKTLNETQFYQAWRPRMTPHGICWMFTTSERVLRTGFFGGLEFYVHLNQSDAHVVHDGIRAAGIRVYVQQQQQQPSSHGGMPIYDGLPFVTVAPGKGAVVGLTQTTWIRETTDPWRHCRIENDKNDSSSTLTQGACQW